MPAAVVESEVEDAQGRVLLLLYFHLRINEIPRVGDRRPRGRLHHLGGVVRCRTIDGGLLFFLNQAGVVEVEEVVALATTDIRDLLDVRGQGELLEEGDDDIVHGSRIFMAENYAVELPEEAERDLVFEHQEVMVDQRFCPFPLLNQCSFFLARLLRGRCFWIRRTHRRRRWFLLLWFHLETQTNYTG